MGLAGMVKPIFCVKQKCPAIQLSSPFVLKLAVFFELFIIAAHTSDQHFDNRNDDGKKERRPKPCYIKFRTHDFI